MFSNFIYTGDFEKIFRYKYKAKKTTSSEVASKEARVKYKKSATLEAGYVISCICVWLLGMCELEAAKYPL